MNKTILVIGEVTRNQYQEARLQLFREGHVPKVVRTTAEEFFLSSADLLEKYGAQTEIVQQGLDLLGDEYPDELYEQCAKLHAEHFGDIGAIIVDEACWNVWAVYEPRYVLLLSALEDSSSSLSRWIAYPGGRVEFAGML